MKTKMLLMLLMSLLLTTKTFPQHGEFLYGVSWIEKVDSLSVVKTTKESTFMSETYFKVSQDDKLYFSVVWSELFTPTSNKILGIISLDYVPKNSYYQNFIILIETKIAEKKKQQDTIRFELRIVYD